MQKINLILNYIHYLQQAKNKFDVHPPFLYELITQVFEDKTSYPEFKQIELLKYNLKHNKKMIEVNDLGVGSTANKSNRRSVSNITKHSSKPNKFGRLLFKLSHHLKPGYVLELGTAMGISAAYMALGNKNAMLTTVEGCQNISSFAAQNIKALNIQNINLINSPFDDILPTYLSSIPHLDMAFIDGNHKEKPTINYFEQCLLKTVNTSCIVFDDIHWSEGMENAWNYIKKHPSVTLSIDLFYMGIIFFRKELSKQHFVIRF